MPLDDFPNDESLIVSVIHEYKDEKNIDSVIEGLKEANLKGCIVIGYDKNGHYYMDGNVGRFEGNFLADRFKEYMLKNG